MSEAEPTPAGDEPVLARFQGDRGTYIREHVMLAALGAVGATLVLQMIGNPYPWTGPVGAVAAIALRGFYVASEALGQVWVLTDQRLIGPSERDIPLSRIKTVNTIFSAAQVVTDTGDKYLIKYQSDPGAVKQAILDRVSRA